jgi:hypothetical protein
MPNVSHDESTVRAVIKGGITEWQNKDKKIRDEELRRITSPKGQLTRKRTFQALKNMMEKSHRGYILSTHTIKDKLRTHKHCFLIHFDFEMSQILYKGNYPELFLCP